MDISTGMYSAISKDAEPDYVQGLEPLRRVAELAERLKSAETGILAPVRVNLLAEPWTLAARPGARQLMGAPLTKENLRHFKRTQRERPPRESGVPVRFSKNQRRSRPMF